MVETDWIEISLHIPSPDDEKREIAMAYLAESGFESFSETDTGIKAYIVSEKYSEETLKESDLFILPAFKGSTFDISTIERVNWNSEWEKNFNPVIIDGRCSVRAPFHQKPEGTEFDIIIEPKMSFGTGHHQTTSLMTSLLLETDVEGLDVLDMGCGTGILAILAWLKKACKVVAVDIDEWACLNTTENAAANNCILEVRKGDIASVKDEKYNLVMANITRNILIDNMSVLSDILKSSGELFLSGFYESDLKVITDAASRFRLEIKRKISKDGWCAAHFVKN